MTFCFVALGDQLFIWSEMARQSWKEGLAKVGLYYKGVVDGSEFESILELHCQATASTFGTRRSCRLASNMDAPTGAENVSFKGS